LGNVRLDGSVERKKSSGGSGSRRGRNFRLLATSGFLSEREADCSGASAEEK
jgi:hypothetical protein